MNNLKISWYKKIQALSLDIVGGALIFSLSIAKYYKVHIPLSVLLCLSISIWLIYTFDHLVDAQKIKGDILTYRHQYHKKNKGPLILLSILLFVVGVLSACRLPLSVLRMGLLTVLFVGIYFIVLHKTSFWSKEIFIACLYTLGIFIAPVSFCTDDLNTVQLMLMPEVFLLVLSNLLMFSWFDFAKDKKSGFPSIVTKLGQAKAEKIIKVLLTTGMLYCVAMLLIYFDKPTALMQSVLLCMYGFLAFIFKYDHLFRPNDSYRVIGDGIFFIPVLILLLC